MTRAILAFEHAAVARPQIKDQEVDIALWSDRLVDMLGCPLMIEVKQRLATGALSVLRRYAERLRHCGAYWGLLVYGEGPTVPPSRWAEVTPNVLTISAVEMFERMRTESFADIVVSLRNRRVHVGDY